MPKELHEQTLRRIEAGESGYAIAHVQVNGHARDISFHKGSQPVGTYHGGPQGLVGADLKEAMILSIAQGRVVTASQQPGAASPATFYRMDIVRMIRDCRMCGDDEEAELLERYRSAHPEVFLA